MKQNAFIAGVGMTPFGRHLNLSLRSLASKAMLAAIRDAGVDASDIQAAYMGNAAAGVITGQVCVPGEIVLREVGIGRIPVVNVENACATASTALNQAATMVTLGAYDVVLACGYEKLVHADKSKSFAVFSGATDIERMGELVASIDTKMRAVGLSPDIDGAGANRSLFMDIYATMAVEHMQKYGTTREQFAAVSAKNSYHGSLNERAQFSDVLTVEQVLAAREIAWPLTLPMCSPIGDGAAAVVLVSERKARELGLQRPVRIRSSAFQTGWNFAPGEDEATVFETTIAMAYEEAGVGPGDLGCVELHDASAPSEIIHTEYLGLCAKGEGGRLVESGETRLGGRIPVNTSGGLLRKGHPIGATGIAQIVELTEQLQGRAGARQVQGAKVGLAENGGGFVKDSVAALVVTILSS
ncbi:acetyl-CoA acetyltransferase [Azospirillum fermentarium]|uniref:thiolase family protein n=1 Tax=Azospirillum fermentarium TaxID=1233114 RepID=UPI002226CAA6|nr:thiolase family protein [Azospirillum fermentarium]MCW2249269.1 acetyl-CoA acetyltransferase [Azospirillum fermentarium]